MQPALAAIWLSVALGASLGIGQRFAPRVTDPIRTFAVVAAALVVGLSLLPHALACEGLGGLVGAALGYAAIPALERLGTLLFQRADPLAMRLELGYSGLLLHRFGDGVAMSVDGHGYALLWALGAHEVPIVALVTLTFASRGVGVALWRAAALGLSSTLGYALMTALPAATWHSLHGWADAIAAGVLVHIVAHHGHGEHTGLPGRPPEPAAGMLTRRLTSLVAGVFACGSIALLGLDHDSDATALFAQLLGLALRVAPALCLGLLARAALRRWAAPLGSVASSLADPAALALSWQLLGGRFALLHTLAALALAGAVLAARQGSGREAAAAPVREPAGLEFAPRGQRLWAALERACWPLAGWVCLGLLAAAYTTAYALPSGAGGVSFAAGVGFCAALAALGFAGAPAAVPLAAALVGQGFPGALALLGLLLGPILELARGRAAAAHAHAPASHNT